MLTMIILKFAWSIKIRDIKKLKPKELDHLKAKYRVENIVNFPFYYAFSLTNFLHIDEHVKNGNKIQVVFQKVC